MKIIEKYHSFKRGEVTCRYGIFGMSREYFHDGEAVPAAGVIIELRPDIPKLKVMQTVITDRCNLKCTYCSCRANGPKLPYREMTRAELRQHIAFFNREIGEDGLLLITGGEPEMHPEAVDRLIDNIRGRVIIFTNGTMTKRDRLKRYRDAGAGVLFSLDGDSTAHDSARLKRNGSFAEVDRAIRMAGEMGFDFGISAVVGDHNIEALPEMVETIFREYRPASMGLNLPHRYGSKVWNRMGEYTEALKAIFQFAKREGFFIDQIDRRFRPLTERKFRFRDCSAQGEKVVVYPGGMWHSCVNEAGLNGRTADWEDQIPLNRGECRDCFAIGICGGGCIFDGNVIYGEGCFDERNCEFTRSFLEFLIWEMYDDTGGRADDTAALNEVYGGMLSREGRTKLSVGHDTV